MKIAVMMRAMDQDSGFRAHVEGLLDALLRIDHENSYLLLYRTPKWIGRFSSFKGVTEVLISAPHKFLWDQVAVPYRAWKEGVDVIFNPKFSVPFLSHCPTTMGLQEPAWWKWPEHYERRDVLYQKILLPLYCRKAAHFFPMVKWVVEENRKVLGLPFENSTVTYPAAQDHLRPIEDSAVLEEFRQRHKLPSRFILNVTRVDHPGLDNSTSFYPGKNPHTAFQAFLLCRDSISHDLVIAGRRVREYLLWRGFKDDDFDRVHFVGFVPFEELPKLYNLADLVVLPPYYESFGFALLAAMACGCPVITSNTGACPEVTNGAALLADPHDPLDFAEKIKLVLKDEALRQELKKKSIERAASFSWDQTAKLTLEGLTRAVNDAKTSKWKEKIKQI